MSVVATVKLIIDSVLTDSSANAVDFSATKDDIEQVKLYRFNEAELYDAPADMHYREAGTIAAGANTDVDLGLLNDSFGNGISWQEINALCLVNTGGVELIMGGHPTDPWEEWTDTVGGTVVVAPGGTFLLVDANGWPANAGSDVLRLSNPSAEYEGSYELILIGSDDVEGSLLTG